MPVIRTRSAKTARISTNATRERCSRDERSFELRGGCVLHELVFYVAMTWMTVLLAVGVVAVIKISSTAGRILALDMLTLILAALLVLYGVAEHTPYYLDAAL